ncbi:MAG TPA: HK97 family phage prohead protease [Bryobacteraceae bacterium]|nr:HK97 family phage prohead protease [Bryobacteraceae bacterium]
MKFERRTFKVEVRKSGDGRKLRGTAVVFNQLSENLGGYREQIAPDALDGCDMADVRCLFNHDENQVLGRTVSRTLALTQDASGLNFECEPPDTTYARDLAACMDRGDIDQCSFSFVVAPGGADWNEDANAGTTIRTVTKIAKLYDVSVVTYPAYTQTSSEIRSSAEILAERRETPAGDGSVCRLSCQLDILCGSTL